MSVYEFECESCGKRFETAVPITEHDKLRDHPPPCPDCKGTKTHQLVSLFNCKVSKG